MASWSSLHSSCSCHRSLFPGELYPSSSCLPLRQLQIEQRRVQLYRNSKGRPPLKKFRAEAISGVLGIEWLPLGASAAIGKAVADHTPIGRHISALILTLFLTLSLGSIGYLPQESLAYDFVWQHVMPLGTALYLLETDLSRLKDVAGASLAAFGIGAVGTIVGTLVAWSLVGSQLGAEGYKLASALGASYIGGSVNFAAVSQSLSLTGPAMAAAMAADNVAMAAYLACIGLIPATGQHEKRQPILPADPAAASHQSAGSESAAAGSVPSQPAMPLPEGSDTGSDWQAPSAAAAPGPSEAFTDEHERSQVHTDRPAEPEMPAPKALAEMTEIAGVQDSAPLLGAQAHAESNDKIGF